MSEMPPESSAELLRQFAQHGSEEAFRQLTARFAGIVYAAAERRLGVMRHLAADVTQAVFILLARRARVLPEGIVLSAWLLRQTIRQSLNMLRAENRRQARERVAAAHMNPSDNHENCAPGIPDLDPHLLRLPARERDAVMLRFFEDQSLAKVAEALGISENAAQKRVARGLERLRGRLTGKVATASLPATLSAHASAEVPPGLLRSLAGNALALGKTAPAGAMAAITEAWRRHPAAAVLSAGISLVAGGGLVISRIAMVSEYRTGSPGVMDVAAERKGLRVQAGQQKAVMSLDEIIKALEKEAGEPRNLRSLLRMDMLTGQVKQEDMQTFAGLAEDRFSPLVKASVFPRILKSWARNAPAAAMDFLVARNLPDKINGKLLQPMGGPGRFLGIAMEIYQPWLERDPGAAARWISANLNAPALLQDTSDGRGAGFLAAVTAEKLALTSVTDMVAFAVSLPKGASREAAMAGVAGDLEKPYTRSGWDAERWREAAAAMTDAVEKGGMEPDVLRRFAAGWALQFPNDYQAWLEKQPDGEIRVYASLGTALDIPVRTSGDLAVTFKRRLSGLPPTETPSERLELTAKALQRASPDKRLELLEYIVEHWRDGGSEALLGEWVHREAPGPEADAMLALIARRASPADAQAITELISDPSQRETLANGLMRRWLEWSPQRALQWLKESSWPADRVARVTQRISRP